MGSVQAQHGTALSPLTYLFCPADYLPCAFKLPSFSLPHSISTTHKECVCTCTCHFLHARLQNQSCNGAFRMSCALMVVCDALCCVAIRQQPNLFQSPDPFLILRSPQCIDNSITIQSDRSCMQVAPHCGQRWLHPEQRPPPPFPFPQARRLHTRTTKQTARHW
jgi:hypothetical protein